MRISTTKNFISDAGKSLKRNKTISIASMATVAATLFILGIFMLVVLTVNSGMLELQSKVQVEIFLNEDITIDMQKNIENKINKVTGVTEVTFVTKSQALDKVKEIFGEESQGLVEGMEKSNPFPTSFIVKADKPQMITEVSEAVKGMPGIYQIKDQRDLVNKIISITRIVKYVGAILFVILIGVSIFLIGNTIKLTVYSRRREIGIMKFIGATDWFIRWPFVYEGLIIGLFGGIMATILLYFSYGFAYSRVSVKVMMIKLVNPSYIINVMSFEFILIGMIIGGIGSIMAIRKFLIV
jgi:cell division transport system permease protein